MERIWDGIRVVFWGAVSLVMGVILLGLVLLAVVVTVGFVVALKDSTVTDGFTLHKYGEYAAVSAYHGTERAIVLPAGIEGQPVQVVTMFTDQHGMVEEITIPDTVTEMAGNCFSGVPALQRFVVSPEHPVFRVMDGALYSKDGQELIAWPQGRAGAAVIPQGVERIGPNAFANCVASEVILPDSLRSIGDYAFMHCHALRVVQIPAKVEQIGDKALNYDRNGSPCLRLIVTEGSAAHLHALRMEVPVEKVLEDPAREMILEYAVRPGMPSGGLASPADLLPAP